MAVAAPAPAAGERHPAAVLARADRLPPSRQRARPRSTTSSTRATPAARSSCASRTPTSPARRRSRSTRSRTCCAGSVSTGTRARCSRARASTRISRPRSGCSTTAHAYECFCTEDEVRERNEQRDARGPPAGLRRPLPQPHRRATRASVRGRGQAPSIRFRTPDEGRSTFTDVIRGEVSVEWSTISDFVIVRSNGTPVFFLANAVDDLDMDITHVLRGEDLIDSTHRVLALRRALGHDDQPVYAHLPLILGPGGAKLSKRHGAVSVEEYRDAGYLPGRAAQLSRAARLGTRRRSRGADHRRARRRVRARAGRTPRRRRSTPRSSSG